MPRIKESIHGRLVPIITLQVLTFITWIVGMIIVSTLPESVHSGFVGAPATVTFTDILIASLFFLAFLVLLYLLRNTRAFTIIITVLLALLMLGTATLLIPYFYALILVISLALIVITYPTFALNNLFVFLAVLAASLPIGLAYTPLTLFFPLVFLSVYDVIGVFKTSFIPNLARSAIYQHTPVIILAPAKFKEWLKRPGMRNIKALLGAGDIFVPLIFLISVIEHHGNPLLGGWVFIGAVIGSLTNILLLAQIKKGVPALPLIVAGMFVAYGFSFLI
ncbi:MAG: presenilin family intramembrane aspartyl protease [Candidatus Uhrbacteria bacterium]|nr:hypothetical protein [Patescibacteria group bacterium]MBU1907316.1 hypothetical protein [Patescibacteria group bacterium]